MKCRDLMNVDPEWISHVARGTAEVVTCRADDEVGQAAYKMREMGTNRLLVVDEKGGPVGVVSLVDILRQVGRRSAEETSPADIELTPSTPEDEEAVAHQSSVMMGAIRLDSMKMFPT